MSKWLKKQEELGTQVYILGDFILIHMVKNTYPYNPTNSQLVTFSKFHQMLLVAINKRLK